MFQLFVFELTVHVTMPTLLSTIREKNILVFAIVSPQQFLRCGGNFYGEYIYSRLSIFRLLAIANFFRGPLDILQFIRPKSSRYPLGRELVMMCIKFFLSGLVKARVGSASQVGFRRTREFRVAQILNLVRVGSISITRPKLTHVNAIYVPGGGKPSF